MTGHVLARAKRTSCRRCILLALTIALFPACAWPQTQLATVFGIITDASGAVIPGAEVTAVNQSIGLKRDVRTDIDGQYHLAGLPPGMYTVRAAADKFQTGVSAAIALSSGATIPINLSLRVGNVPQRVTVNADVAIDTTTSSITGAIAERGLSDLPLNSRDLFKAAVLQPGVAPTASSAPSLLSNGNFGQ